MRFLKSRQNFGRVCFRKGTGDGGNLQDRRDIVRVPVAFVTSGSMMRPPPPPPCALGYPGRRDWTCRGPQVGSERSPQPRLWKGHWSPRPFPRGQGATRPSSAAHEEVGL